MPLIISKRPATLGELLSARPKIKKDEQLTRLGIQVRNVGVSAEEFGELMLDQAAHKHFYRTYKGREPQVRYKQVHGLTLDPFDHANVSLYLGRRVMKIPSVKVVKNYVGLHEGGISNWSFSIQATPDMEGDIVPMLMNKLGQDIQVELVCETYGAQPELSLEEEDDDDEEKDVPQDEEDDDERVPGGPQDAHQGQGARMEAIRAGRKKGQA